MNDGLICANINQDEYTCLLVLSENHSATSFFLFILQKACYSTRTRYHSPANVLRRLSENFTFQCCQCRQVIRRQSTFTLIILKYPSLIHIFAFFVLFAMWLMSSQRMDWPTALYNAIVTLEARSSFYPPRSTHLSN